MLGIALVHKDVGCTSHDAVNDVRRQFNTRRVGHAGTLDPQATGLLVVAIGPATRFLQYLPLEPKEYLGRFQFGVETDSYDAEGEVISRVDPPADLRMRIEQLLPRFKGLIQQLPPMYSAVKVAGKPLYRYARQGQDLKREPRTVHIGTFAIEDAGEDWLDMRIVCSGGTYIRSLAFDLGRAVGCGAHLAALRREKVGRFHLTDAHFVRDLDDKKIIPLRDALEPMPMVPLSESQTASVREGRPVLCGEPPEGPLAALLTPEGSVFSVARIHGNVLQPECVIPAEAMVHE